MSSRARDVRARARIFTHIDGVTDGTYAYTRGHARMRAYNERTRAAELSRRQY